MYRMCPRSGELPVPDDSLHVSRDKQKINRAGVIGETCGKRTHVDNPYSYQESCNSNVR